jgi:hypothetical protein
LYVNCAIDTMGRPLAICKMMTGVTAWPKSNCPPPRAWVAATDPKPRATSTSSPRFFQKPLFLATQA